MNRIRALCALTLLVGCGVSLSATPPPTALLYVSDLAFAGDLSPMTPDQVLGLTVETAAIDGGYRYHPGGVPRTLRELFRSGRKVAVTPSVLQRTVEEIARAYWSEGRYGARIDVREQTVRDLSSIEGTGRLRIVIEIPCPGPGGASAPSP